MKDFINKANVLCDALGSAYNMQCGVYSFTEYQGMRYLIQYVIIEAENFLKEYANDENANKMYITMHNIITDRLDSVRARHNDIIRMGHC